jgi:hypothetical protein
MHRVMLKGARVCTKHAPDADDAPCARGNGALVLSRPSARPAAHPLRCRHRQRLRCPPGYPRHSLHPHPYLPEDPPHKAHSRDPSRARSCRKSAGLLDSPQTPGKPDAMPGSCWHTTSRRRPHSRRGLRCSPSGRYTRPPSFPLHTRWGRRRKWLRFVWRSIRASEPYTTCNPRRSRSHCHFPDWCRSSRRGRRPRLHRCSKTRPSSHRPHRNPFRRRRPYRAYPLSSSSHSQE